jgi:hypothetical protein
VKLVDLPNGGQGIAEIRDLQIVNGGQTTASLYQAVRKDKADISGIYVQTKLKLFGSSLWFSWFSLRATTIKPRNLTHSQFMR